MNRLFEIIYLLIDKKNMTAAELAQHFEVSERTIYRDLEALSVAGIPVYARKGRYGGISLLDNFVLNKVLVTKEEQQEILAALQSLNETPDMNADKILRKMKSLFQVDCDSWVSIDYSDWSNQRQELFLTIKSAVLQSRILTFDYYNTQGSMLTRQTEPLQLYFRSSHWYLRAYCLERQAVRLFKLSRMKNVVCVNEHFTRRKAEELFPPEPEEMCPSQVLPEEQTGMELGHSMENKHFMEKEHSMEDGFQLKVDKDMGYRVYDIFDDGNVEMSEDGNFLVTSGYLADEWVLQMILSFGKSAVVVYPESLKNAVKEKLEQALEKYS